jgi:hypothetical protein
MATNSLGPAFIKLVYDEGARGLSSTGMRRRTRGIGTWQLASGFLGWIGLNAATRSMNGTMVINANVGVVCEEIQKLIHLVEGAREKYEAFPTICMGIGYLMPTPTHREFIFRKESPVAPVVDELVDAVNKYGIPYVKAHCSLQSLVEPLDRLPRHAHWGDSSERLVALRYLMDGRSAAERTMNERRAEGQRLSMNLTRFDAFCSLFIKYMDG